MRGFRGIFESREQALARKHRRYKLVSGIVIAVLVLLLGGLVFLNYDYMVFKFMIADHYAYDETLADIYAAELGSDKNESFLWRFDNFVIAAATEKLRNTNGDRYTYLYTPPQYVLQEEMTKAAADEARIEALREDVVYLRLPNISKYTLAFLEENKEELRGYAHIVIDLRQNPGGSLDALYDMCELFLDKNMRIAKEVARTSFFTKDVKAKSARYFTFESITFLQDGNTASASESMINALRENLDNVTVLGTQSFGKGIGQITMPLKDGYAVKATVLLMETPDGNCIHTIGVTPDVVYENEDIIEFALKRIPLK